MSFLAQLFFLNAATSAKLHCPKDAQINESLLYTCTLFITWVICLTLCYRAQKIQVATKALGPYNYKNKRL